MLHESLAFGLDAEQEASFRKHGLTSDIEQARIGILLIFVPIMIYVFNDYQVFGGSAEFYGLAVIRGCLAIYGLALFFFLAKVNDHRSYDKAVSVWLIVAVFVNLAINLTRPENFVVHVIVVAVFVFIIYLMIPNKFIVQIAMTSVLTVGEFLIVIFATSSPVMVTFPISVSLIFVWVIASISSWQFHDQRRKAFMEMTDRNKAEEAMIREKDRLTSLVNSISDEVWFADPEGRFTLTNPSAAREFLLGNGSGDVAVEKMASELKVLRIDGSPRPLEEAPPLKALKGEVVKGQEEMVRTPIRGELRYRR